MALENVVFQQDPFSYGWKDFCSDESVVGAYRNRDFDGNIQLKGLGACWDSPPPSMAESLKEWETDFSSPEVCTGEGLLAGAYPPMVEAGAPILCEPGRRKRRRIKSFKSTQDTENQRMTHIAVERNRRRQVNDYLAIIRSMMPPSYAQRGDQASIVGGAINFVKELEQLLQSLEGHKQIMQRSFAGQDYYCSSPLFANFFAYPQYATCSSHHQSTAEHHHSSTIADIEVAMAESHASIKVLTRRHPKQLLKLVTGLHSVGLPILHLNVTTVDRMVLYSFSVKVEDNSQLSTVNEIATSVHEMIGGIQEDSLSS